MFGSNRTYNTYSQCMPRHLNQPSQFDHFFETFTRHDQSEVNDLSGITLSLGARSNVAGNGYYRAAVGDPWRPLDRELTFEVAGKNDVSRSKAEGIKGHLPQNMRLTDFMN